ncbi:hypothetical protein C1Y40_04149 [Mycobacterium talmoniae]|uniref:Uncharacterized protein n=1 Tax=Mycobacterium talmoniae TaxID=1858794 RepID=A0A2S8BGG2_9MYCO|nr:hypothetical protein C1Y40_04149 [Mycobacterium talmoniae]
MPHTSVAPGYEIREGVTGQGLVKLVAHISAQSEAIEFGRYMDELRELADAVMDEVPRTFPRLDEGTLIISRVCMDEDLSFEACEALVDLEAALDDFRAVLR